MYYTNCISKYFPPPTNVLKDSHNHDIVYTWKAGRGSGREMEREMVRGSGRHGENKN
jgi:myo-inositol catabolism protein IolC